MIVIGLTGGIASGKSTAAEMLRGLGAVVIDADRLGHRSYEPGTRGFQKVVNAFGHDIVGKDGVIDRRILGGKVFGAPEQMDRLNSIVWPEIRSLIQEEIQQIRAQDKHAIIVLEAAVLLEARWQDLCNEIWVVLTPVQTAVERLRNRNGLSEDAAMARINSQMSNKERADVSDVQIENAGTEDQLRQRVEKAWTSLQSRLEPEARRPIAKKPRVAKPTGKAGARKGAKSGGTSARTAPKAAAAAKAKPTARQAAKPASKAPAKSTAKAAPARKATTKAATAAPAKKAAAKPAAKKPATSKATSSKATAAKKPATRATASKAAAAKAPAAKKSAAKPTAKSAARPASKAAAATKTAKAAKTTTRSATARSASKPAPPKAAAARKPVAATRTAARKAPTRAAGARSK